jgi:hypothetical protein
MPTNQDVACPMITRFQLLDPNVLKELVSDLYAYLIRALKYTPNEDGVYQSKCSWCKTRSCWTESKAFLTKRGLDAQTVIELLESDFHLSATCDRDLIHNYCLEEVLKEIDYTRIDRSMIGDKRKAPEMGNCDAVLKITNPDHPQDFGFGETIFLYKPYEANSGLVLNDIKKAYGIARTIEGFARDFCYLFVLNFVASCLITATMQIPSRDGNDWSYIDRQFSDVEYFYSLNLDLLEAKWRLEGQRFDHGIFLVDEWKAQIKNTKARSSVEVYELLNKILHEK